MWRSRPLLAIAGVGAAGPPFVLAAGKDADAPLRLRLVGLVLASLLALVWEDRTAPLAAATPVGLPALQRARLLMLLLGASGAWALACLATAARDPDARVWSATVEVAAVAALLTAIVGALARERPGESLSAYPMPLLLVLLVLVVRVPQRWALIAMPGSPDWDDVHRRWAGLLAVSLLAMAFAGRDPAFQLPRRASRTTAAR